MKFKFKKSIKQKKHSARNKELIEEIRKNDRIKENKINTYLKQLSSENFDKKIIFENLMEQKPIGYILASAWDKEWFEEFGGDYEKAVEMAKSLKGEKKEGLIDYLLGDYFINSEKSKIRKNIIEFIEKIEIKDKKILNVLINYLKDEDEYVRKEAQKALMEQGDLGYVLAAAWYKDWFEEFGGDYKKAIEMAKSLKGEEKEELIEHLIGDSFLNGRFWDVMLDSIKIIRDAKLKDKRFIDALARTLSINSGGVKYEAQKALMEQGALGYILASAWNKKKFEKLGGDYKKAIKMTKSLKGEEKKKLIKYLTKNYFLDAEYNYTEQSTIEYILNTQIIDKKILEKLINKIPRIENKELLKAINKYLAKYGDPGKIYAEIFSDEKKNKEIVDRLKGKKEFEEIINRGLENKKIVVDVLDFIERYNLYNKKIIDKMLELIDNENTIYYIKEKAIIKLTKIRKKELKEYVKEQIRNRKGDKRIDHMLELVFARLGEQIDLEKIIHNLRKSLGSIEGEYLKLLMKQGPIGYIFASVWNRGWFKEFRGDYKKAVEMAKNLKEEERKRLIEYITNNEYFGYKFLENLDDMIEFIRDVNLKDKKIIDTLTSFLQRNNNEVRRLALKSLMEQGDLGYILASAWDKEWFEEFGGDYKKAIKMAKSLEGEEREELIEHLIGNNFLNGRFWDVNASIINFIADAKIKDRRILPYILKNLKSEHAEQVESAIRAIITLWYKEHKKLIKELYEKRYYRRNIINLLIEDNKIKEHKELINKLKKENRDELWEIIINKRKNKKIAYYLRFLKYKDKRVVSAAYQRLMKQNSIGYILASAWSKEEFEEFGGDYKKAIEMAKSLKGEKREELINYLLSDKFIENEDLNIRLNVYKFLEKANLSYDERLFDKIYGLIENSNESIRDYAIKLLEKEGKLGPIILKLINKKTTKTIEYDKLNNRDKDRLKDYLFRIYFRYGDKSIRKNIINYITKYRIRNKEIENLLISSIKNEQINKEAIKAITALRIKEAKEALLEQLDNKEIKKEIIEALLILNEKNIVIKQLNKDLIKNKKEDVKLTLEIIEKLDIIDNRLFDGIILHLGTYEIAYKILNKYGPIGYILSNIHRQAKYKVNENNQIIKALIRSLNENERKRLIDYLLSNKFLGNLYLRNNILKNIKKLGLKDKRIENKFIEELKLSFVKVETIEALIILETKKDLIKYIIDLYEKETIDQNRTIRLLETQGGLGIILANLISKELFEVNKDKEVIKEIAKRLSKYERDRLIKELLKIKNNIGPKKLYEFLKETGFNEKQILQIISKNILYGNKEEIKEAYEIIENNNNKELKDFVEKIIIFKKALEECDSSKVRVIKELL